MWRPSSKYSDGNYYGFGIGAQVAGKKKVEYYCKVRFP